MTRRRGPSVKKARPRPRLIALEPLRPHTIPAVIFSAAPDRFRRMLRGARGELRIALSPEGLPAEPIALEADEEIIYRAPVVFVDAPNQAEAILICKAGSIPAMDVPPDDPIAQELAKMFIARGAR